MREKHINRQTETQIRDDHLQNKRAQQIFLLVNLGGGKVQINSCQ